ncbi:MAG: FlgD immunoglobulin-like domain containing protein [Candidatus Zixiibacteriota bacterium]
MNCVRFKIPGLVFLSFLLLFSLVSAEDDSTFFRCLTPDSVIPPAVPVGSETLSVVAIYACGTEASTTALPSWWERIWQPDTQHSVPKFYKDNSFGNYIMNSGAFGQNDTHCFTFVGDGDDPFNEHDFAILMDEVIPYADMVENINFGDFDNDTDGIVDGLFFIVVNHSGDEGFAVIPFGYTTNDTNRNGDQVSISPLRTVAFKANSRERAVTVAAHEWGHILGRPNHYGSGWGGCAGETGQGPPGLWGLGAFSIMGTGWPSQRAVPFDPYNRIQLGWATPITVTVPLFGQTIPDYLISDTIYKLPVSDSEYFLVTNHKGVDPAVDTAGIWEARMPGDLGGLMIWHIRGAGDGAIVDCELAQGRYNYSFSDTPPYATVTDSNPNSGRDSLDFLKSYCDSSGKITSWNGFNPAPSKGVASRRCWWNQETRINFDGLSNPNSNGFSSSTTPDSNGLRFETVPSRLAVRNISKTAQSSATADLLVNNWYGHISANTTWGPNKAYAITGDITVDTNVTLTIDSNTTVYFQANEDNQKGLPDTAKSALVVKPGGTLLIKGTKNYPAKFLSSKSEGQAGSEDWQGIVVKPGAIFACSNAVIRHAYAGIEDSSNIPHTIQNVKVGKCKMYGILAVDTDSLTIRGCRVDSVGDSSGGIGIKSSAGSGRGARLVKDTVRNCFYGIYLLNAASPVDTCVIDGAGNTGVLCYGQGASGDTLPVPINYTTVSGSFTGQLLQNHWKGKAILTGCNLLSATSPSRTPYGIHGPGYQAFLKARRNVITEWNNYGVVIGHNSQSTDLGKVNAGSSDSGYNTIFSGTGVGSWKYVIDLDCNNCSSPVIKAEWNCWASLNPSSSRFSGNIDYNPYHTDCIVAPKIAAGGGGETTNLPKSTELFQNYPNPFNPTTLIQFRLEKPEKVNLEIFNILGQKVRTVVPGEELAAGPYTFLWDGRDNRGSPVSSGVYFYKLKTPTYAKTHKMMLVK